MHTNPEYSELVKLIDERSAAFRATLQAAPDLGARVPGCPDWTLLDLARHLGAVQRRWAEIITTGPSDSAPAVTSAQTAATGPAELEALLPWLADGTRQLLDAAREAGPDRGIWSWWGDTQSPQTSWAAIRHQAQEAAVHTYDAQTAFGPGQPLPAVIAVDGVEEFTSSCGTTTTPWPHEPATLDIHAAEGPSWRVTLSETGARYRRLPDSGEGLEAANASLSGSASDIVLVFYFRLPLDVLECSGEVEVIKKMLAWEF